MKKKYAPRSSTAALECEPDEAKCKFKPECKSCLYAGHGFICYNASDGTCLKDWRKSRLRGSDSHAGG